MTDSLEQRIIDVVESAISNKATDEVARLTPDDSMDTIAAWDSLSFMSVFEAINQEFGLAPDFDEAIHYTSIRSLHSYLSAQAG